MYPFTLSCFTLAVVWLPLSCAAFAIGRHWPLRGVLGSTACGAVLGAAAFLLVGWLSGRDLEDYAEGTVLGAVYFSCFWIPIVFGAFAAGRKSVSARVALFFAVTEGAAVVLFVIALRIADL
jgi:hypothetical protein